MRKWLARIGLALAITALALIGARLTRMCQGNRKSIGELSNAQSCPTIQQIQALSQLVTERVNVSDVIESQLAGRTGSIRAIVVVTGSMLISTELSRARLESIDESGRRVVLVLPQPTVLEATVDHEHTHIAAIFESGLWRITPGDDATSAAVVDLAYRDAQRCVAGAAKDDAHLLRARQHAEEVLVDSLRRAQWGLVVRWQ